MEVLDMEFHEKLQELRKARGLTQEELAQALYVSRTAVSKWESARGYPSIDSLKEISRYFSVSIDDLLSGEKLISIAEKENQANLRRMCALLFAVTDAVSFLLIILPLYPSAADGYVYSVNLPAYMAISPVNCGIYGALFALQTALGLLRMLLERWQTEKRHNVLTDLSVAIHILAILYLAVTRQAYATAAAFVLLVVKSMLLFKSAKAEV